MVSEILSVKVDVIFIAVIAIANQLDEVVVSQDEAKNLKVGNIVNIGTKAFSPTITSIK